MPIELPLVFHKIPEELMLKCFNHELRSDKPNRWIKLPEACALVAKTLNVPVGEAQKLLRSETSAVPWAGVEHIRVQSVSDVAKYVAKLAGWQLSEAQAAVERMQQDDGTIPLPAIIGSLKGAKVSFGFATVSWPNRSIEDVHVELNHLEARLEKEDGASRREASDADKVQRRAAEAEVRAVVKRLLDENDGIGEVRLWALVKAELPGARRDQVRRAKQEIAPLPRGRPTK